MPLDESFTANVVATTPAYAEVFALRMVEGSFLVESALPNSVVIGSDAAIALFMRVDVVGEPLMIGNEAYTIVGVYETDEYFVRQMSTSLYEAVYVPVQADEMIQSVFISADHTMFERQAVSELTEAVHQTVKSDQVIQHAERMTLLRAMKWLLLELLCVIMFVWLGIRFARRGMNTLKRQWYLYAGGYVLLLTLFVVLQNLAFVPSAFLPADNIFDIKHYVKLFYSLIQSANVSGAELSILFTNTLRALAFVDALIILCIVLLFIIFSTRDEKMREDAVDEKQENAFR
ncbi:MAG: ABC transporter permease [Clostridia bacterium]